MKGSPTEMKIVRPRVKSRGRPFVMMRWVPQTTTGTIGTPASSAIRAAPVLNPFSSNDRLIVASGNTPTISPRRR